QARCGSKFQIPNPNRLRYAAPRVARCHCNLQVSSSKGRFLMRLTSFPLASLYDARKLFTVA
ncbi:hypothetical protein NQ041_22305, partial [Vibrio diabolicus]|uniref:hypothetical protein n=1 Tax=Vibrio diabolicus TaxID=50719 RepID=UPI00211BD958